MLVTGKYPQRRLDELVKQPMESLTVELKEWLDPTENNAKANLAKGILAHANSGGGYIVVGFTRSGHEYQPVPVPDGIIEKYDHDTVNAISNRYCDPSIHLECYVVIHSVLTKCA